MCERARDRPLNFFSPFLNKRQRITTRRKRDRIKEEEKTHTLKREKENSFGFILRIVPYGFSCYCCWLFETTQNKTKPTKKKWEKRERAKDKKKTRERTSERERTNEYIYYNTNNNKTIIYVSRAIQFDVNTWRSHNFHEHKLNCDNNQPKQNTFEFHDRLALQVKRICCLVSVSFF